MMSVLLLQVLFNWSAIAMNEDRKAEISKIAKALSEMTVYEYQECIHEAFILSCKHKVKKGNPILDEIPECFINENS